MKEIRIDWRGPFSQTETKYEGGGIYQFYGFHPVYGEDVLLYIGKTLDFTRRMEEHKEKEYLSKFVPECFKPEQIKIYLGYVRDSNPVLEEIEKLLIFAHSPAWNSSDVACYNQEYNIKIVNEGEYKDLSSIVEEKDYL